MQAHLKADKYYSVIANMRGTSPEDVASRILSCEALRGLQVLQCLSLPSFLAQSPARALTWSQSLTGACAKGCPSWLPPKYCSWKYCCIGCVQGPTISPVYSLSSSTGANGGRAAECGFYAATICVPKARLYTSVKDLRGVSGDKG